MMKLEKTNLPGFAKNKKSNVLINTNEDKINQSKRNREQYIKQQAVNREVERLKFKVDDLQQRLAELEEKIKKYDV